MSATLRLSGYPAAVPVSLQVAGVNAVGTGPLSVAKTATPGADYAEFHSGMVRGGSITIAATGVILRDVDVIAPPASAIIFASGAADVRIVRGNISGWARDDIGVKPNTVGWGRQHDAGPWATALTPSAGAAEVGA